MSFAEDRLTLVLAATTATLMIAHQVAAKTARDSLFLTHFDVTWLPPLTIAAAVASGAAVLLMAGLLARLGPARIIPLMYGGSGALFALEWLVMIWAPAAMTVVLFLHISVLGSILISGFWSIINERYDPYRGKQVIAKLAAAATLGGLVGGLGASAVAAVASAHAILLLLAVLHLFCGLALGYVSRGTPHSRPPEPEPLKDLLIEPLKRSRLIRFMALLVALVAANAALLDYLLKAAASESLQDPEQLVNFFSIYYVAVGLGGFLLQSLLGKRALGWFGIGGTMAVLPILVMAGGVFAFAVRNLMVIATLRAGVAVSYNSLFRTGFESLYTPIPPADKRAGKILIDVGADRSGDMLGSLIVMLILLAPAVATQELLLAGAGVLSALILVLIVFLNRGYVAQLANNLRSGVQRPEQITATDATTLHTIAVTRTAIDRDALLREINALGPAADAAVAQPSPAQRQSPVRVAADPVIQAITDLRSGDSGRVTAVLSNSVLSPVLLPHLIPLLADQNAMRGALRAIRPMASQASGQLVDSLLDRRLHPLIRRRLPILLGRTDNAIAVQGLCECLLDDDADVARRCAQALHRIRQNYPHLRAPDGMVEDALRQTLLRVRPPGLDEAQMTERRHVFDLLGIIYHPDVLDLCYDALQGSDPGSRGTALEYLDNLLPDDLKALLWKRFGGSTEVTGSKRSLSEIAGDLRRALPARRVRRGKHLDQTGSQLTSTAGEAKT